MPESKPSNKCTTTNATMNNIIHSGKTTECQNPDPKSILEVHQALKDGTQAIDNQTPTSSITLDTNQTANNEKIPMDNQIPVPNICEKMDIEPTTENLMKKTPDDDSKPHHQQPTFGIEKSQAKDEGQRMIDGTMDPTPTITSRPLITAQEPMIEDKEDAPTITNQTANKEKDEYNGKMGKDSNGVAKGGKYLIIVMKSTPNTAPVAFDIPTPTIILWVRRLPYIDE